MSGTLTGSTVIAEAPTSVGLSVTTSYYHLAEVTVRNSIIRGGAADVEIRDTDAGGPYRASLDIDYSAVRTDRITRSGTNTTVIHGASNTDAEPPLVATAGAVDTRQRAGSPTINAGSAAAASGQDLDGDPRTVGGVPDIGADEFVPPPSISGERATSIGTNNATIDASINPNARATVAYVEYGPTIAYGARTPETSFAAAEAVETLHVVLAGLGAGTSYHARIVARSDRGERVGTDIAFTTNASRLAGQALAGTVDRTPPTLGRPTIAMGKTARSLRFWALRIVPRRGPRRAPARGSDAGGKCQLAAATGRVCVRSACVGSFAASFSPHPWPGFRFPHASADVRSQRGGSGSPWSPSTVSATDRPPGGSRSACGSAASIHQAVAAGPVGLAETELLELARCRARESVTKLQRGRAFEMRHPLPGEVHDVLLTARRTGAQDHEGLHRLAPLLVGHTDDGHVGDIGMAIEAVLNLD